MKNLITEINFNKGQEVSFCVVYRAGGMENRIFDNVAKAKLYAAKVQDELYWTWWVIV